MKTRGMVWVFFLVGGLACLSACVDKDYDWDEDKIDKNIVASPDGFAIPLPGIDTVFFSSLSIDPDQVVINGQSYLSTSYTLQGLFDKNTNDKFFQSGTGSVSLNMKMTISIASPHSLKLIFMPKVLDAEGNVLTTLDPIFVEGATATPISVKIKEENMIYMDNATGLMFDIRVEATVERFVATDYFALDNLGLSKDGGINLNLDDL